MPDVERRVTAIIAELLGRDPETITRGLALGDDLGMKAIDLAEIAMEIEGDFAITVFSRPFGDLRTVGDVVDYVETCLRDPLSNPELAA